MSRWTWTVVVAGGVAAGALTFMLFGPRLERATDEAPAASVAPIAAMDSLTLNDLHGAPVPLSTFKGKVVILNFWATWCGPCRVEIPDLIELQAEHPDDLAVVGIIVMDPIDDRVPRFVEDLTITYPILDGNDRDDLETAYGPFIGLPTSVILDRDGLIVSRRTGAAPKQMFADVIAPLL